METVILRVSQIEPDRSQPRKYFDEKSLYQLADSITQYGVIEPIVVRPMENGFFKIVAGERRWRASRIAQLREIPAIVKENLSDLDAFKLSFTENLQRQSLTPIEEALGFMRMREEFLMTQEEISQSTGRSRASVANILRLLKLPKSVQRLIDSGQLSVAHAKMVLSADPVYYEALANLVIQKELSVRQLEEEIKKLQTPNQQRIKRRNHTYVETELSLKDILNRPIKINGSKSKGTLTIEFYGEDDLKSLVEHLVNQIDKYPLAK